MMELTFERTNTVTPAVNVYFLNMKTKCSSSIVLGSTCSTSLPIMSYMKHAVSTLSTGLGR